MDHEEPDEAQHEETWSALALALEPIAPQEQARAQLFARLRGPERYALFAAEASQAFGLPPEVAEQALRSIDDPRAWQQGPTAGSSFLLTPALLAAGVVISRLPKGTRFEHHRHPGRELTLVLDGTLIENGERTHGAGALLDMPPGSAHEVAVVAEGGCLVVFASRQE
jgi:quercetin dioxygenase-like cupin family protein